MINLTSILAGFISGTLGAMGLGGGGVLVIYLTLFSNIEQIQAQGINLIFFVFMALIAVIIYSYKKLVRWKIVFPITIFGAIGALLGFHLSSMISSSILSRLFGILLLYIGILQIFKRNDR